MEQSSKIGSFVEHIFMENGNYAQIRNRCAIGLRPAEITGSSIMHECLSTPPITPLPACEDREWARRAIGILQGDGRRSADTHLVKPVFKGLRGISIYLKDESTHPTGSLKHRLARSLFLYGICNGKIRQERRW